MKKYGANLAVAITRLLATWTSILFINILIIAYVWHKHLFTDNALEVFNLILSILAFDFELVILNCTLNLGDTDREKLNKILRKDDKILKQVTKK